ncbi:unnamed protein product [Rangifer tarandus platyrhynchus]|uniref:Uncharacterized protein n=2 Tax=Rangifer tarandus platyrhynchus TaxID=3082113 RepID=A0ABN8YCW7_RANTA|nr:unnamed protein product [Rangifer tarandus platyrhynchus]CAI9698062.1 unnamed protein product [Rangifer tarandus platyrhynchus]
MLTHAPATGLARNRRRILPSPSAPQRRSLPARTPDRNPGPTGTSGRLGSQDRGRSCSQRRQDWGRQRKRPLPLSSPALLPEHARGAPYLRIGVGEEPPLGTRSPG